MDICCLFETQLVDYYDANQLTSLSHFHDDDYADRLHVEETFYSRAEFGHVWCNLKPKNLFLSLAWNVKNEKKSC